MVSVPSASVVVRLTMPRLLAAEKTVVLVSLAPDPDRAIVTSSRTTSNVPAGTVTVSTPRSVALAV